MRTRSAGTPEAELAALAEDMRQVVGSFVRRVRTAANTPREARVDTLADLDRWGSMTVTGLAGLRHVRHQSMRVVVAQLEADGLVVRAPDGADARGQIVAITEAGRDVLVAARVARTQWIAAALQADTTGPERRALATAVCVLRRMAAMPD